MNPAELVSLAGNAHLDEDQRLRLAFGMCCVERVEHLLTDERVMACLMIGRQFLAGTSNQKSLESAARAAASYATQHSGSNSLDGAGNAAVSTSHAVAVALAGNALSAAEYAAYARVYSYASYAVTDIENYSEEHAWQVAKFKELAFGKERNEGV